MEVMGNNILLGACSHGTNYVSGSNNLLKLNPITKTQCKARLYACIWLDETITTLRVDLKLNNDLSPTKVFYFRSSKNLMSHSKRRLELNIQVGINLSINFKSLAIEENGYENLTLAEMIVETILLEFKNKIANYIM